MAPTPALPAPHRLLRALSLAPRLPSQPGADPDSPASSPEIELDLLGPQGDDGAAHADHRPAACQQISTRRRVTQLSTTSSAAAAASESPASTPSSSPTSSPAPLPLAWSPSSQSLGHLRRHRRNGSVTSVVSDASSLSTASSDTGSSRDLRQNRRIKSKREVEAESVWRDFWS
ncbi:hypothetical protein diail_6533 [Diaporthe ilicicola]|nr:hypothetical protein diail_6533 [Diaporthe ilicicola]